MDKNTIWAIVLSTLVIVGSYFLLPKVFGTKNNDVQEQPAVEVVTEQTPAADNSLFSQQDEQLIAQVEE